MYISVLKCYLVYLNVLKNKRWAWKDEQERDWTSIFEKEQNKISRNKQIIEI